MKYLKNDKQHIKLKIHDFSKQPKNYIKYGPLLQKSQKSPIWSHCKAGPRSFKKPSLISLRGRPKNFQKAQSGPTACRPKNFTNPNLVTLHGRPQIFQMSPIWSHCMAGTRSHTEKGSVKRQKLKRSSFKSKKCFQVIFDDFWIDF